jgi:hypothetical protein
MGHVKIVAPNEKAKKPVEPKYSPVYHQSDLFLPKNRVGYYVYKPARTLPPNAPLHRKLANSLQLAYYKYELATGLYMMNGRERALINFLVIASVALTIYHFIL